MELLLRFRPLGIDILCFGRKFLVYNLVGRNLKTKYRRSALGFFWTLLVPLANAGIYYFAFHMVLKVSLPHYLSFVLTGVFAWTFFAQTVTEGMESIVGNYAVISKVPVPTYIFAYVGGITNFTTYLLSFPILLGATLVSGVPIGWHTLAFFPYALLLFMLTYSFSLIFSIAFVYFQDLRHILAVSLQLWFYATPVVYAESMIPEKYRFLLTVNPLAPIILGFQDILVNGIWPSASGFASAFGWTVVTFALAVVLHHWFGSELVERV
jgi:ABC-type polysaccharide/polyol phosphate export permease